MVLARRSDDFISRYSEPPSAASLSSGRARPKAELQIWSNAASAEKDPEFAGRISGSGH